MNLLEIPPEMFTGILRQLDLNDILSFRRASKYTQSLSDDHIRLHIKTDSEIIVGPDDGYQFDDSTNSYYKTISMATLLQFALHLPANQFNLKLKNEDVDIFELSEFFDRYGNQITHMKMNELVPSLTNQLPEKLPNLEYLAIDHINVNADEGNYWKILKQFEKLETLRVPEFSNDEDDSSYSNWRRFARNIVRVIKLLSIYLKSTGPMIKFLDVETFKDCRVALDLDTEREMFKEFLTLCAENNLKLLNVPMEIIKMLVPRPSPLQTEQLIKCVISVTQVRLTTIPLDFENLEKVSFDTTKSSLFERFPQRPPVWPSLTTVEVNVNKKLLQSNHGEIVFSYLFRHSERSLLTDLSLIYEQEAMGNHDFTHLKFPNTQKIVGACPNLTKLVICNWRKIDKSLSILWSNLPQLKEICLQNCVHLSNAAFIGESESKPALLQLANLQKLSLLGIHNMPKITDVAFKLVFKHLQVREFHLTSWKDNKIGKVAKVKSITRSGIKSLLSGNFVKCIKRFPFDCWALDGVTRKEFRALRDQFRSPHLV